MSEMRCRIEFLANTARRKILFVQLLHQYSRGETYTQLSALLVGQSTAICLNDEIAEHFLIGYNTYRQITDIINDLENLNDSHEIKNHLYRILL